MLESYFLSPSIRKYRLAAIAVDVFVPENGEKFDALQIKVFATGKEPVLFNQKYVVKDSYVDFLNS